MASKKSVSLMTFLKGSSDPAKLMPGCCNYVQTGGGCLVWGDCLVELEKRCNIFEEVVLKTAEDIGRKESIYGQYEAHVGIKTTKKLNRGIIRICPGCNEAELAKRQRFCESCKQQRRQKTNRKNQRKYYQRKNNEGR